MFIRGEDLEEQIREITRGRQVRCAVAFWGQGAASLFPDIGRQKVKILCNLKSGGTNPFVIEKLEEAGVEIRQSDELHAKVYIGEDRAIVTSANASANGLGLEGAEQAHWVEAGVSLDDVRSVTAWFKEQWRRSREITGPDIAAAKAKWARRRQFKPSLSSFADFDCNAIDLPLVYWAGRSDWEPCEENIKAQLGS